MRVSCHVRVSFFFFDNRLSNFSMSDILFVITLSCRRKNCRRYKGSLCRVTPRCDPMWHVSFRYGDAGCNYTVYFTYFLLFRLVEQLYAWMARKWGCFSIYVSPGCVIDRCFTTARVTTRVRNRYTWGRCPRQTWNWVTFCDAATQ